jgi:hypothetical protein
MEVVRHSNDGLEVVPAPAQYVQHSHHVSPAQSPYGYPSPPPQYSQAHDKGYVGNVAELGPAERMHDDEVAAPSKTRRKWWIIGVVVFVLIAAVGGAVGGVMSNKKAGNDSRYGACILFYLS